MKIVGIDPGLQGGFALIENGKLLGAIPMPLIKGKLNFSKIGRIFKNDKPDMVYLERIHAMYGASAKSTFSFGSGFGALQGIMIGLGVRYTLTDPKEWQKVCHAGVEKSLKPKERSALAAQRLFPGYEFERNGRLHDGMVDAALIAHYGSTCLARQNDRIDDVVSSIHDLDSGAEFGISALSDREL